MNISHGYSIGPLKNKLYTDEMENHTLNIKSIQLITHDVLKITINHLLPIKKLLRIVEFDVE